MNSNSPHQSVLSKANHALRSRDWTQAALLYQRLVDEHYQGISIVHPLLLTYAESQLKQLRNKFKQSGIPNIVLTACNSKYFGSALVLIQSLLQKSADTVSEILVFNLGLDDSQLAILKSINKIKIYSEVDLPDNDTKTWRNKFNLSDTSTYFFKAFAIYYWWLASSYSRDSDVNILWIDSGIKVQNSLEPIFRIIQLEGCFFIDHSDTPFYYDNPSNLLVNVLSPSIENGSNSYIPLLPDQLLTPYIKANFFGLRSSGKYAYLLEDFWDLCINTNCLFDPRKIKNSRDQDYWLNTIPALKDVLTHLDRPNSGKYLFGRHEQSIWSYLVARDGITIHDTKSYNFTAAPGSNSLSKKAWVDKITYLSSRHYQELRDYMINFIKDNSDVSDEVKGFDDMHDVDKVLKLYLDVGQDVYFDHPKFANVGFPLPDAAMRSIALLHRGSMARLDQQNYSGTLLNSFNNINDDIFILLGNGPSLADVDLNSLKKYHTFGLNAAYRAYERIGFWPKYFGCFDALVCNHHSSKFKELIRDSQIEKFFFINFDDSGKEIFVEPDVISSPAFQALNFRYRSVLEKTRTDLISISFRDFLDMRTSGSNSIQAGLLMGYRKFILLGVDANYVEVVDGAQKDNSYHKLVMNKTPDSNPNYWFSDYQQKGDKFNRPNLQKSQIPAWNNLSMTLQTLGINCMVYNCSPITQLECFPKASLNYALNKLNNLRAQDLRPYKSPVQFTNFV